MTPETLLWLPVIWATIIAAAVFLYVCMDGFDLGLGILFPWFRAQADRDVMVNSIAPVWDGNETWLVFGGAGLFAAFPLAYATILPALYMPLIAMLLALIGRGVSFEMRFRTHSDRVRAWWDRAFAWGSVVATFCQGIALGGLVQGIRVEHGAYAGGWWDWLTPFSVFTGLSLLVGYGLLAACWLIWKTTGPLAKTARRLAFILGCGLLACIGIVSLWMLVTQAGFRMRWLGYPGLLIASPVPVLTVLVAWRFRLSLLRLSQHDQAPMPGPAPSDITPLLLALALFLLSYFGLGFSLWPHIVPPGVTLWDAAAAPSSQRFLLAGAAVLLPLILGYTGYVYWLFRGKVEHGAGYH